MSNKARIEKVLILVVSSDIIEHLRIKHQALYQQPDNMPCLFVDGDDYSLEEWLEFRESLLADSVALESAGGKDKLEEMMCQTLILQLLWSY